MLKFKAVLADRFSKAQIWEFVKEKRMKTKSLLKVLMVFVLGTSAYAYTLERGFDQWDKTPVYHPSKKVSFDDQYKVEEATYQDRQIASEPEEKDKAPKAWLVKDKKAKDSFAPDEN